MIWGVAILTALACVQAAPNNQSKESAHDMESESVSHEAESKEVSDESLEADSEYQDKDSKPDKAYQISRIKRCSGAISATIKKRYEILKKRSSKSFATI
ncbi:uncharacterized protein [Halyomorpha halys]